MPVITVTKEEEYKGVAYREGAKLEVTDEVAAALGSSVTIDGEAVEAPAEPEPAEEPAQEEAPAEPEAEAVETKDVDEAPVDKMVKGAPKKK